MEYHPEDVLGISKNVHIRRESDKIIISHLPHMVLNYGFLTPTQAVILSLIDGNRKVEEIIDAISYLLDLTSSQAKELFFRFLNYISPSGEMIIRNAKGRNVNQFNPLEFLIPSKDLNYSKRLEAPLTINFALTYNCEANCIYCYASRMKYANDQYLPTSRILELLEEMVSLGIWQVNFCGGDPFCHQDILIILEKALGLDMIVDISTKAYINEVTAFKLDEIGLDYIQVSIEASTVELGDFIFGRKGQYKRVIETLKNLLNTNIFTRTNSIIVKQNLLFLEDIIQMLQNLGIKDMKFSPAFRSMHINNEPYILNAMEIEIFEQRIEEMSKKYERDGITVHHAVMPDPTRMTLEERENYWFFERPICSAGRSSMLITPNGKVAICEEAPKEGEFIVGDVRSSSILDVWNSQTLLDLAFPQKERFKNTPCEKCEHFDSCVNIKGHCFKDAYKGYGEPFTVNPFCPKAPEPIPRLY